MVNIQTVFGIIHIILQECLMYGYQYIDLSGYILKKSHMQSYYIYL